MGFDIAVHSLLQLLHLLIVLDHILAVNKRRQESVGGILILERRWLLKHKLFKLLWVQSQLTQRIVRHWLLSVGSLQCALIHQIV